MLYHNTTIPIFRRPIIGLCGLRLLYYVNTWDKYIHWIWYSLAIIFYDLCYYFSRCNIMFFFINPSVLFHYILIKLTFIPFVVLKWNMMWFPRLKDFFNLVSNIRLVCSLAHAETTTKWLQAPFKFILTHFSNLIRVFKNKKGYMIWLIWLS